MKDKVVAMAWIAAALGMVCGGLLLMTVTVKGMEWILSW